VKLLITGGRDLRGRAVQKWSRRFRFRRTRRFDMFVSFDARLSRVVDRFGPGRLLSMESVIEWRATGELVMRSTGWALRPGDLRIPLPEWLFGTVTGVQTVHPSGEGRMGIMMKVSHPLLGDIFGYEGTVQQRTEESS
jgi:hypothetical protein